MSAARSSSWLSWSGIFFSFSVVWIVAPWIFASIEGCTKIVRLASVFVQVSWIEFLALDRSDIVFLFSNRRIFDFNCENNASRSVLCVDRQINGCS